MCIDESEDHYTGGNLLLGLIKQLLRKDSLLEKVVLLILTFDKALKGLNMALKVVWKGFQTTFKTALPISGGFS